MFFVYIISLVLLFHIVLMTLIMFVVLRRKTASADINYSVPMTTFPHGPNRHSNCESPFHKDNPSKATLAQVILGFFIIFVSRLIV